MSVVVVVEEVVVTMVVVEESAAAAAAEEEEKEEEETNVEGLQAEAWHLEHTPMGWGLQSGTWSARWPGKSWWGATRKTHYSTGAPQWCPSTTSCAGPGLPPRRAALSVQETRGLATTARRARLVALLH